MQKTAEISVECRARDLYETGFPRAAIDVLHAHLVGRPDDGSAWRLRAVLLYREGRWKEAFDDVQRALVLAPLGAESWVVLADGYIRSGKRRSAADVLARLAADDELPYDLWLPVFDGLFHLGMWQAALAVGRRAASERPEDDLAYFSMAHAMLRGRQPTEQAIHLIERAIALNPVESRYRVTLAVQLLRLGRRREAHECVAALSVEAIDAITCRCCLEKFLRLTIDRGDAALASQLAGRLAQIAAANPPKRPSSEDSQ